MHKVCGLVAAISLLASPLAWAGPLHAGNAAGVRQARLVTYTGAWLVGGGLGALSLALIAVAVSDGDGAQSQAAGTTTTTTTTTTTATTS